MYVLRQDVNKIVFDCLKERIKYLKVRLTKMSKEYLLR